MSRRTLMSHHDPGRSPVLPGDVVAGRYRVDRVIGAGGMGVVVAATHLELEKAVALKFILPHQVASKDALERFMREARSVARLQSEHVARVFDFGRDESGTPFMALELLEGHDLATMRRRGRIPTVLAVDYVVQACDALIEAHALGIVHRDLKPQNLFVTQRANGTPFVKVLDFGIAKVASTFGDDRMHLTDSQTVIGSPLYMAPEHMRSSRSADVRSDIWSLGVILYELLAGILPFDGDTVTEVCLRVVGESPAPLADLNPDLPPALVSSVMRCLAKEPADRWQTVAQLAAELRPFAIPRHEAAAPWRSLEQTTDALLPVVNPPAAAHPALGFVATMSSAQPDFVPPQTSPRLPEDVQLSNGGGLAWTPRIAESTLRSSRPSRMTWPFVAAAIIITAAIGVGVSRAWQSPAHAIASPPERMLTNLDEQLLEPVAPRILADQSAEASVALEHEAAAAPPSLRRPKSRHAAPATRPEALTSATDSASSRSTPATQPASAPGVPPASEQVSSPPNVAANGAPILK